MMRRLAVIIIFTFLIINCTYHKTFGSSEELNEEESEEGGEVGLQPPPPQNSNGVVEADDSEIQVETLDGEIIETIGQLPLKISEYVRKSMVWPPGEADNNTAVANVYNAEGTIIDVNSANNTSNSSKVVVNTTVSCIQRELPIDENGTYVIPAVEIVNTTVLHGDVLWMNSSMKSRSTPSNCSIVLFYAHWCPFSAKAAPHFNALARAFPYIRVAAIDSTVHSSVNSFFGILSVPTILLFHNGKTVAKFNDTSFTLNKFADFVHAFTDLKSDENINVTSQDFAGPLSSVPSQTQDIWLYLAWVFIVVCFVHYTSKSTLWRKVSDLVRTTWREAEAQHEHTD